MWWSALVVPIVRSGGTGGPRRCRTAAVHRCRPAPEERCPSSPSPGEVAGRSPAVRYHAPMDLPAVPEAIAERSADPVLDRVGRRVRDLRVSVTDRCNFRCTYCMPREVYGRDFAFLPHDQVLSFEEIERLARLFVAEGVEKLRITGGEPLVRRDLPELIGMLAALRRPDGGPVDVTLTTNGSALRSLAGALRSAGLGRVTVSLDSLDEATFRAMNGVDFPVAKVLDGIAAAREAGFGPIKVNMVVRRGLNEASVAPMARWARDEGHILRFIEYMDVGHSMVAARRGRAAAEVVALIHAEMPARGDPAELSGRGRDALAPSGRWRGGGGDRIRHPALLRGVHPGPDLRRRATLHVPLRREGDGPAGRDPVRRVRRRAGRRDPLGVGRPRGPLLRAPLRVDPRPAQGRDVRDGRVGFSTAGPQVDESGGHARRPGDDSRGQAR